MEPPAVAIEPPQESKSELALYPLLSLALGVLVIRTARFRMASLAPGSLLAEVHATRRHSRKLSGV